MAKERGARASKTAINAPGRRKTDATGVAREIYRRMKRETAASDSVRSRLLSEWLGATPWTEDARLALHEAKLDTGLVRLTRWLLKDDARAVLGPLREANRGAVESFVAWVLQLTATDVAFFTTAHSGWVTNTYGPPHHRPGAELARDIEQAARLLGVPVPDALRVPEMPFLDHDSHSVLYLGHRRGDAGTGPRKWDDQEPAVFVLLSYISDWEACWWLSGVTSSSVHNDAGAALAAFRSHQSALEDQAEREIAKVKEGTAEGTYLQQGGFDVINVLFRVPLAHRTVDAPSSWELLEDTFEYVVEDGSYSMEFGAGSPEELRRQDHVSGVDLMAYLPPAAGAL